MWRNFSFPCMTIVGKLKISPHVEKFQMSPHDRCGEIWNSPHMACVWCRKRRHICKIHAIFTRFHVEKNWAQKHICGEKMTNMRSVPHLLTYTLQRGKIGKGLVGPGALPRDNQLFIDWVLGRQPFIVYRHDLHDMFSWLYVLTEAEGRVGICRDRHDRR